MSHVEDAITAHWGPRCDIPLAGCFTCDAWAEYDRMIQRYDEAMERIHNMQAELEYLRLEVNR